MRVIKLLFILSVLAIGLLFIGNFKIHQKCRNLIFNNLNNLPECYTGIVPGTLVSNSGAPSIYLQDRLDAAIVLYRAQKIKRFLLSGDHGQIDYDEVNSMKHYLMQHGIDSVDIFLDHAGFDTYNTMTRAKQIFQVDNAILISQEFNLPRAIYIAKCKGIKAYGYIADRHDYPLKQQLNYREKLANIKAFLEVNFNIKPKYLGSPIPITGNSWLSYD